MPRKFSQLICEQVRKRASYLCEYCHSNERWQYIPFTIDHVVPISAGGEDTIENLALACFHCNRQKSDKYSVMDELTGNEVSLFNPRQMTWAEHFEWSKDGLEILPRSEIGRVTIELLKLNRERVLQIRLDDILVKRHPPAEDSIQE